MNVSLTPELERLVAEKVESGLYESPGEVVREGLRRLDAMLQVGLDPLDRGKRVDWKTSRDRMLARFKTTTP